MTKQRSALMTLMLCVAGPLACSKHDSGTSSAAHQLTVHTGLVQSSTTTSHVFLGDGSVFATDTDNQGDAIFRDARLTLPQDVTWVQAVADTPSWVGILTIVAVDTDEIWLHDTSDSSAPTIEWEVTGDVTPHAPGIQVVGAGGDYWATSSLYANGYALNLRGTTQGNIDVAAWNAVAGTTGGNVTSVGVAASVPIVRNANTTANIALDHAATPTFAVTAINDSAYGGAQSAALGFSFASLPLAPTRTLFANSVSGTFPVQVSTPSMDGPLSALRRTLNVTASRAADGLYLNGIDPAKFNGSATIEDIDASATSATVTFLTPAAMTSPALGKLASPGTAAHDKLTFTWTNDAAALVTRVTLSSGGAYNTNPRWVVYLPSSQTTFTFPTFTAPNGVTVLNTSTTYQVELESFAYTAVPSATDLWTDADGPSRVELGNTQTTYQTGFLQLQ